MEHQTSMVADQIFIDYLKDWMPDLQTKTYFIPDILMNRMPCEKDTFAGQEVMIWKKTDGSNFTERTPKTPRKDQKEQKKNDSITHCSSVPFTLKDADADSADLTQDTSKKTQKQLERKDHTIHCTGMWSTLKGPTQLKPVQDCYIRDDRAQQHVLYCLRKWADIHCEEIMVVLSQLQYSDYLSKPCFAELVKQLPKPGDMKSCRGDFDVLIIHKQFGLIVLEIKSIGINADELNLQDKDQVNKICKKVEKGIEQLTKAERVLSHLVNDMETEMFIRKSIILPYVTTSQLRQAVILNKATEKKLCSCLGTEDLDKAIDLCLCSDTLHAQSASWIVTPDIVQNMHNWWEKLKILSAPKPHLSLLYERLVARFCGPATVVSVHCITSPRIELRTKGEAVAEAGNRMALLALYPEQLALLTEQLPLVFLAGPPGTGKSIVLVLKGLQWLRLGHAVHVVSTWDISRVSCYILHHQLKKTVEESWEEYPESTENKKCKTGRVCYHEFNFRNGQDVKRAVEELVNEAQEGKLYVLADEVGPDTSSDQIHFQNFFHQLHNHLPHLYLWSAAMHHKHRPEDMIEKKLTAPLRCPPIVLEEVIKAKELEWESVYSYTKPSTPAPCDGPHIVRMYHEEDHSVEPCARDCQQCGLNLANYLKSLHVGQEGPSSSSKDASMATLLQYKDVLILYWTDKVKDTGLVKGLQKAEIPVQVLGPEDDFRDLALATTNKVTVAHHDSVRGLERKIVVYVGSTGWNENVCDRLHAISRTTSLLIWLCKRLQDET